MRKSAVALLLAGLLAMAGCKIELAFTPLGDFYEPNDDTGSAYPLAVNTWLSDDWGLGVQDGDDDYYELTVTAGNTDIIIDCTFSDVLGDINLVLYNSSGTPIATATTITDNEQIIIDVGTAGTYYLIVEIWGTPQGNSYDLKWEVNVIDDDYEPNDSRATAYPLAESTLLSNDQGLGIEADDNDYFEISVGSAYTVLTIDCTFTDADGDIDIRLLDSNGTTLASSTSWSDDEQIVYDVGSAGTYYVYVFTFGASQGNTYDLIWSAALPGGAIDMNGFWLLTLDNVASEGNAIACLTQDGGGNVSGLLVDILFTGTVTGAGNDTLNADLDSGGLIGTAAYTAPQTLTGFYNTTEPWTWVEHTATGSYSQTPQGSTPTVAAVSTATNGVGSIESDGGGNIWSNIYFMTPTQTYRIQFNDEEDDIIAGINLSTPYDVNTGGGLGVFDIEFQDNTAGGPIYMAVDHGTITFTKYDATGVAGTFDFWFDMIETDGLTGSFDVPWDVYFGNPIP